MKKKKNRLKHISIKLPACGNKYPFDKLGCRKLPDYESEYLKKYFKKHGNKLFELLLNNVPYPVYSELVKRIRQQEKI